MKIGIFGGSFDPIHNGHLMLASSAQLELELDKVIFVPCNIPNYGDKVILTDVEDRIAMVSKCMDGVNFDICLIDIERKGISYTIDTVKDLKKRFPDDELFLIIGPDCVEDFHKWKDYEQIKKYAKPMFAMQDFYCPSIAIRGTLIRKLVKEKMSIKGLVPEKVEKYIKEFELYRR